ncbi:hypothetical protein Y5S_03381 [Alcanivorax nanhaiticus]|uniref:Uncharacterized protein n=2 Tax=Alcanivorax nanhaiticus TaxID=1177154 RepID=A0A095ULJ9_9GAMM|nr:hypothetical protein Y5S_03381 [Alcanivorax nanhaiticus]OUW25978.1 MAG: hypothetical protein CBD27_08645 [Rhodospirillaceae bacterium TMED167]
MVRQVSRFFGSLLLLAFMVISLAGGANRMLWVNDDSAMSYGSMSDSIVRDRLGVELPSICLHDEPQHVEFKRLQGDVLEFRCSWLSGGGLTWWPFYSEVEVNDAQSVAAFNALFSGGERDE